MDRAQLKGFIHGKRRDSREVHAIYPALRHRHPSQIPIPMSCQLDHEVFKIVDRETGGVQGAYSRAYRTEYEFKSVSEARSSNCHGMYRDKAKFKIQKWKVSYELVDDDVDPPTEQDRIDEEERMKELAEIEAEMDALGIRGILPRISYHLEKRHENWCRRMYLKMAENNNTTAP